MYATLQSDTAAYCVFYQHTVVGLLLLINPPLVISMYPTFLLDSTTLWHSCIRPISPSNTKQVLWLSKLIQQYSPCTQTWFLKQLVSSANLQVLL